MKYALSFLLTMALALPCVAQEETKSETGALEILKSLVGVWDAEMEVWPRGPDKASMKLKGVETNKAYGKHWLTSDFSSKAMGPAANLHSIVGYDLDKKQMVAMSVDSGPYPAKMTGEIDVKKKSVTWTAHIKDAAGNKKIQKSTDTLINENERIMIVKAQQNGKFVKIVQIKFTKRKK